eukprot:TRINITY_DN14713_c0_g1_i1.p1 TRINITY_DN14713_c0_g1~~TRINITY_DN14713_c0_g1_i1.p1  ORF type:complete len:588 (-),score=87.43 TRINITY_DN14713_c0_g1_i1:436-2100(-)
MLRSLVGSEMCIRDRYQRRVRETPTVAMPVALSDSPEVPAAQDHFAGEILEHIASEYGACDAVAAVHTYYSNIGEYTLREDMDPRAFIQFIVDSRLLAEDFTMFDAEDICRKLVEDGYQRFPLPAFWIGLAKIAFYKYRLSPQDSAETLIDDHILPLEGEAVSFMLHHGPRLTETPHPQDLRMNMSHHEMMHRVYLFYTEPGKPMFWDDFRLLCNDFQISPDQMSMDDAAQIFHSVPTRHLTFEDFMGPVLSQVVTCLSGDHQAGPRTIMATPDAYAQFMESLRGAPSMQAAMDWYDDVYGKNAPHRRKARENHVGILKEDESRKDQPVRPAKEYREPEEQAKYKFKSTKHAILPGPDVLRNQGNNPFLSELKERQRAIQLTEPVRQSGSHSHSKRAPAPYGREPHARDAQHASMVLQALCQGHRVDLHLLFDTYGRRDADKGRGVILGDDLHQLVWDAGLIGQGHRLGVTKSINAYFEKCVGSGFRGNLPVSYERFQVMLVRTGEWMAAMRDHAHPNDNIDFAMEDLVRDYLVPLAHAKFWKEYYGHQHLARQ